MSRPRLIREGRMCRLRISKHIDQAHPPSYQKIGFGDLEDTEYRQMVRCKDSMGYFERKGFGGKDPPMRIATTPPP